VSVTKTTDARSATDSPELHCFEDSRALASGLAERLGARCRPIEVRRFPDEESLVRVESEGARRAIVVRSLDRPDRKILELLFTVDALRRRGVRELVLVAPYLAYMRQDRVFRSGEAVSQQVVGGLLGAAFDEILTIEAHLHRIRALDEVFPCRARSISAAPVIADWCRRGYHDGLLVGPDAESEPWVKAVAERSGLPWIVCEKRRHGDREVEITLPELPEPRERAIVIDDIASSGATLAAVTRALHDRGIRRVEAVVAHAIFGPGAEERMHAAGLAKIFSTDTLPHPSNAIRVADLLATQLMAESDSKEEN
jgi:ribose-phosphate pyrophosphokinase